MACDSPQKDIGRICLWRCRQLHVEVIMNILYIGLGRLVAITTQRRLPAALFDSASERPASDFWQVSDTPRGYLLLTDSLPSREIRWWCPILYVGWIWWVRLKCKRNAWVGSECGDRRRFGGSVHISMPAREGGVGWRGKDLRRTAQQHAYTRFKAQGLSKLERCPHLDAK